MSQGGFQKIKDTVSDVLNSDLYANTLNYCASNGVRFVDKDFPPQKSSIVGNPPSRDYAGQFDVLEWRNADQIFGPGNYSLWNGINIRDVQQGALGNCYFLCALTSLSENPALITRLFETDEVNPYGVYAVWINVNGIWQRVIVDDYFPVYNPTGRGMQLAFSRTDQNELWVLLLEKAYAKVYGGYWNIIGGDPVHALRDLTGAPYERIDKLAQNVDETWAKLLFHFSRNHVLTCYTQPGRVAEEKSPEGIVGGHAYSILDVVQTTDSRGNLARLLKIRNPWGRFEWNGDFSDNSSLWTQADRQRLGVVSADDGVFWIRVEDFARLFQGVGVVKAVPGFCSNGIVVDQTSGSQSVVRIIVRQQCQVTFSVDQYDSRLFQNSQIHPTYSYFRLTVGKVVGENQIQFVNCILSPERNIFAETILAPGEYLALIEGYWENGQPGKVNFCSYSNVHLDMQLIGVAPAFFQRIEYLIWRDFARSQAQKLTFNEQKTVSDGRSSATVSTSKLNSTAYGVSLFSFGNHSNGNAVHQKVQIKEMNGYSPIGGNISGRLADVVMNPQDSDIMVFKMDPRETNFRVAVQVVDEELIPHRFNPDLNSGEFLHNIGGVQPTPDNMDARLRSVAEQERLYDYRQQNSAMIRQQMMRDYEQNMQIRRNRQQRLIGQQQETQQAYQNYLSSTGGQGWNFESLLGNATNLVDNFFGGRSMTDPGFAMQKSGCTIF